MNRHTDFARRFDRLWNLLSAKGASDPLGGNLIARWSEPHRHYHTLAHLDACLASLDAHRVLAEDHAALETALWFHDAVYDPRSTENEQRSAELAREVLADAKVGPERIDRVQRLILATRAHESDGSTDSALMLDIDLAVLGGTPDDYARYSAAIRREYD